METWKYIFGYEGKYVISNHGNVKSLPQKKGTGIGYFTNEYIKPPRIALYNYLSITLYKNSKGKTFSIHRLVANAFIPNLLNKAQVNHKDGNKLNNHAGNLEWVTSSENHIQIMARANLLMADYNKKFREEKKEAYRQLTATVIKDQRYYAPSLAKDYIDSQCSESGYIFDLAERTSRLSSHTMDAIRTIISSLKSERIFSQYQT